MSVIVMTKYPGKATDLEAILDKFGETLQKISQQARDQGCVHHMFVEDTDGDVLIIDEWDGRESFDAFFAAHQDDIQPVATAGGSPALPRRPPTASSTRPIGSDLTLQARMQRRQMPSGGT